VRDSARRSFICQLRVFGTVPRVADNSDELVRQSASHGHGGLKGFEPGSFALPGLSFCGNYPCDMLARLKTSLRTLDNHQIKPFIKARIYDRRVRMNRTGGSTTNGLLPVR